MNILLLSLVFLATLVLPVHASSPAMNADSQWQAESLAYRCAFRPVAAADSERSDFYARYLHRQRPVPLRDFIQWFQSAYPKITQLQCVPYETIPVTAANQNLIRQGSENPVEQSVIDYVFGDFPGGYTEEQQRLEQEAYGRQHQNSAGDIIVIGFTGNNIASNGLADKKPFVWLVQFTQWGGRRILGPCLACLKNWLSSLSDYVWTAW